jgi:hypothetical protein
MVTTVMQLMENKSPGGSKSPLYVNTVSSAVFTKNYRRRIATSTNPRAAAYSARAGSTGDFFGVPVGQGVGIVKFLIGAGVFPGVVMFAPGVVVVFTAAGVPVSVAAVVVTVVVVFTGVAVVVTVVVPEEESEVSGATKWTVLPSMIVTRAS